MWQTIVTKISVFGTKTMISDRKTMYSAKYKASRVNDMVFHAEIEIFDRNVLQASYKKAKCLVSGTETFFFRMKTPISDWNENFENCNFRMKHHVMYTRSLVFCGIHCLAIGDHSFRAKN
jgi:hypothetical protein